MSRVRPAQLVSMMSSVLLFVRSVLLARPRSQILPRLLVVAVVSVLGAVTVGCSASPQPDDAVVGGEAAAGGDAVVGGEAAAGGDAVVGGEAAAGGDAVVGGEAAAGGDAVVGGEAAPSGEAAALPSASPSGASTPIPTPIPPTPTPEPPDLTPVVHATDDWAITEGDVERMHRFVETVHELAFERPVGVEFEPDVGVTYARNVDLLPADDWRLHVALGLIPADADRDDAVQYRRDRIRGLCCIETPTGRFSGGDGQAPMAVVVEPLATKLETEVVIVHELVHALHLQHGLLGRRGAPSGGFEAPDPRNAVVEAIPQFVAFRYLEQAALPAREVVEPELPIVRPHDIASVGDTASALLNFAYFAAPAMVEWVHAELGAAGLSDLLRRPPTTTEQVVFPDRWLVGEDRVSQAPPALPAGARFVDEGRLGVVILEWLLGQPGQVDLDDRRLLSAWTGDRWTLYRLDGHDCVAVVIEMDTPPAASELRARLADRFGDVALDAGLALTFDTCATGNPA